jgi:hypothetical protein
MASYMTPKNVMTIWSTISLELDEDIVCVLRECKWMKYVWNDLKPWWFDPPFRLSWMKTFARVQIWIETDQSGGDTSLPPAGPSGRQ